MGQQHYRFAYSGLKQFAFERTSELEKELWGPAPEAFLQWLWEACADGPNEPCPGLSSRTLTVGGRPAALVTLPEPTEAPCAYFVAILLGPEDPGYYSLEMANTEFGGSGTVLGRWYPDLRQNLGDGPEPEAGAFLDSVAALEDKMRSRPS